MLTRHREQGITTLSRHRARAVEALLQYRATSWLGVRDGRAVGSFQGNRKGYKQMTKITKVYLPDDVAEIVSKTAVAEGVSVSGMLSRLIAEQIGKAGDLANTDSIAPSEYRERDAVRFNVVLPKAILNVLEARAESQGKTRMRYIVSVLTSHASIEPVYDNAQQAQITRMIDKVHALAVSNNLVRTALEANGVIPAELDTRLLTILEVCGTLLRQLNQMQLANVERWRIR